MARFLFVSPSITAGVLSKRQKTEIPYSYNGTLTRNQSMYPSTWHCYLRCIYTGITTHRLCDHNIKCRMKTEEL